MFCSWRHSRVRVMSGVMSHRYVKCSGDVIGTTPVKQHVPYILAWTDDEMA